MWNLIFDGKSYIIKALIILEDEIDNLINYFHIELDHIEINRRLYEIERRGLYINKLSEKVENITLFYMNKYIIRINLILKNVESV